jgi:hypothetical protein
MRHPPLSLRLPGELVHRVDRLLSAMKAELPAGAILSRNSLMCALLERAVKEEEDKRGLI